MWYKWSLTKYVVLGSSSDTNTFDVNHDQSLPLIATVCQACQLRYKTCPFISKKMSKNVNDVNAF